MSSRLAVDQSEGFSLRYGVHYGIHGVRQPPRDLGGCHYSQESEAVSQRQRLDLFRENEALRSVAREVDVDGGLRTTCRGRAQTLYSALLIAKHGV